MEKNIKIDDNNVHYNEFLTNYLNLSNHFYVDKPIEMFTMYNYMLHNGYLSLGNNFELINYSNDISSNNGSIVMTGEGDSKHISAMLRDIYIAQGLFSSTISTELTRKYILKATDNLLKGQDPSEVYKLINGYTLNKEDREFYYKQLKKLNYNLSLSKSYFDFEGKMNDKDSKHVITMVTRKNKNYFLDATQEKIYNLNEENTDLYDDDNNLKIIYKDTKKLEDQARVRKLRQNFNYRVIYEDIPMDDLIETFEENIDIFDKFYKDNVHTYSEVSNKVLKYKKGSNRK